MKNGGLNYYGLMNDGSTGWNSNLSNFQAGGVTDGMVGNKFYDGTGGTSVAAGGANGGTGAFGLSNNTWGNIGTMGSIASVAGNWIMGNKALDQAQEKFDFQKDSWEKQFAMMQDQYYRKLNNRRANRYATKEMSGAERISLDEHYDSGANLDGDYLPNGQTQMQQRSSPSVQNANMMTQATGGAPYSPAAAQGMLNAGAASNSGFAGTYGTNMGASPLGGSAGYANPAPSQSPVNPAVKAGNSATREVVRRKKKKPVTQSSNDGTTNNPNIN